MVIRFRASASKEKWAQSLLHGALLLEGVNAGIYNNITYAIDKNGEDPVGSESNGKFTVDMEHAKDNMALTVNVNCQPNDAAEPASIANQKVKFISLSKLLTSTFGATDAKKVSQQRIQLKP